jgi:hypothetical protein
MRVYIAIFLIGIIFFPLSGCRPPTQMKTPFSSAEFEPYKAKGTGKIVGQAFLKTRGGDVKTGAGNTVQLWPFTPFMKEVISLKEQGYSITNYTNEVVNQILPYVRESIGDGNGNFEFSDLLLEITFSRSTLHGMQALVLPVEL